MIILLVFAFLSGLVTIAAPCIWPLLPIILSSSTTGGKLKPLGITLGIIVSFAFFTLSISAIVKLLHIDPNVLRLIAVVIIGFLGVTLVVPSLSAKLEGYVSRFSNFGRLGSEGNKNNGFLGGLLTGFSLGIVWSPCAGPILATIATLSATQAVNANVVLVTVVYCIGVGIPHFYFSSFGAALFAKSKVLNKYTGRSQQLFGVVMVLTALAIYTNYDKVIQVKLLDAIPSYSNFLISLESNNAVSTQLEKLKGGRQGGNIKPGRVFNMGLSNLGQAPEFAGIYKWLNAENPLSISDLRGKVVLIDFWTYTCINCIRTLPHVTGWYEKYKDKGFVVIGVHTPEFEFEKKTENVEQAIKQYSIHYPVAQDNDYLTWNAYQNQYWPAKYLIDKDGTIRYTHFGEGKYDETEQAIRKLLEEAGNSLDPTLLNMPDQTPHTLFMTPETYLGEQRLERFASNETVAFDKAQNYHPKSSIPDHYFAYEGVWTVEADQAIASAGSALMLHFNADKVFLVANPPTALTSNQPQTQGIVKVYLDGKPINPAQAGQSVQNGQLIITSDNTYELVNLNGKSGSHLLRLEFQTDGTAVFAFTFG